MHQALSQQVLTTQRDTKGSSTEEQFLIVVSHELRTPTAAILGSVELLAKTATDQERFGQGLDIIRRNAQLQAQLIEHLIDFSLMSTDDFKLELQKISIVPTLTAAIETMRPLALKKSIRIAARLDPLTGFVVGDTFRLQQVFTNLLSNAIKFTPSGGHIRVSLTDDGSSIEVQVSDTGKGISAETLADIFNGFRHVTIRSATESGGLGLGLNISRRLIERHGGRIDAFSNGEGHGATFTVQLPRADVGIPNSD